MKHTELSLLVSQQELFFLKSLVESERFNLSGIVKAVRNPRFSQELEVAEELDQKISKLVPN